MVHQCIFFSSWHQKNLQKSVDKSFHVCYNAIVNNAGKSEGEIKLPVQVWDKIRDEEIPELNIVNAGEKSDCKKVRICMSNSFAFGGANSSLVIGCRG